MLVADLIAHYRAAKTLHDPLSPSLEEKLPHLEGVFGRLDAHATPIEIGEAARAAWGHLEPGTRKRYLVQLRAVFGLCEADGVIDRAPRLQMPYVSDTVVVDVSSADIALLLAYLKWTEPRWYPLALILCHTGARLGEALALTASSLTARGVRIERSAGRRTKTIARTVPYTPLLQHEVASGAFKTKELQALNLLPKGVSARSAPACLGRVLATSTTALALPRLRVHDLRHAFAAMLAENGADLADIAAALGHSSVAMAMRYRGLVRGRLTAVMSKI